LRGQTYEGIFRAFSPRLELTLDMVHPVDPKDPSRISEEKVSTMVFKLGDVVSCSAIDTDLDYAIKGKQIIVFKSKVLFCCPHSFL
jgi:hypothetical protein